MFRFRLGQTDNEARLAPLTYDVATGKSTGRASHTYYTLFTDRSGASSAFFYIPKGTHVLDLDLWTTHAVSLRLYSGLPSTNPSPAVKDVTIAGWHTHHLNLDPAHGGTIARLTGKAGWIPFPYLHSVPRLWAKSPTELLIPRAIATTDGLTISET